MTNAQTYGIGGLLSGAVIGFLLTKNQQGMKRVAIIGGVGILLAGAGYFYGNKLDNTPPPTFTPIVGTTSAGYLVPNPMTVQNPGGTPTIVENYGAGDVASTPMNKNNAANFQQSPTPTA